MKKKTLLALGLALFLVLALATSAFAAEDLTAFPAAVDPQSWTVPENMTWDDWKDNPVVDWETLDLPNAQLQKGLIMLVDYQDSPFIMTKEVGSDPIGNPQVQVPNDELADFWKTFLNAPADVNHGANINEFWRENSYGNWKVEIEVYGPYTLPGMEWEYGIDGMNGARSAKRAIRPDSVALFLADMQERNTGVDLSDFTFGFIVHAGYDESGAWEEAGRMLYASPEDVPDEAGPTFEELEAIKAWGAAPAGSNEAIYDARGRLTNDITWAKNLFAGVTDEGEYIIDRTDEDQDGYPDKGANWIQTRYIPWTSWFAGKSVWSSASGVTATEGDGSGLAPGTYFRISIQGESDGMATFAHEFGHIKGIGDNYNNPFDPSNNRSYTGVWELMSRGSFAGPYGTHNRWQTPCAMGSSAPAQHTSRLKLKQDFYAEDQYTQVKEEDLITNGPVFETVVARNVPAGSINEQGIGYGVNSLMITMDTDNTPIVTKSSEDYNWQTSTWGSYNQNNAYYGKGYYQFYAMEVVQRTGYDSFACDEGVMITMNRATANLGLKDDTFTRENESAPFMWIIDSHPNDINLVDYKAPDGSNFMVAPGDARQLADALFHAGAGKTALPGDGAPQNIGVNDVVSEYIDTYNNLHFYILTKNVDDQGVLSYRVAVRSNEMSADDVKAYSDQINVSLGDCSPAVTNKIAVQEVKITNYGTDQGLYRLAVKDTNLNTRLDYNVIEIAPGETVTVPVYIQVPYRATAEDFTFSVKSEVSGKIDEVTGTFQPKGKEDPVYSKDYADYTTSVNPGYTGEALDEFPGELDPQSWELSAHMDWDDLTPHPYIDWLDDANLADDVEVMRGLVILVDFEDQPMFLGMEPGTDFMGNPVNAEHPAYDQAGNPYPALDIDLPMAREDMASFYKALLNEGTYLNGQSINKFWRENSYGHWSIELEVVGPYTLPGMEWEYGVDDMQNIKIEGTSQTKPGYTVNGTAKTIISDSVQLFLADQREKAAQGLPHEDLNDYNFGFILHAGYDESGLWQEASDMKYQTKDSIPEDAGPTFAELESIKAWGAKPQGLAEPQISRWGTVTNDIHWAEHMFAGIDPETGEYIIDYTDANNNGYPDKGEKWAGTRYVEFTCWKAAKTVWSHATSYRAVEGDGSGLAPGTRWRISCQGESDGMGTFAHEFGHIKGIADNYCNSFQRDPILRTYVGNLELMGAGDKNGPYGTHARYIMPSTVGDVGPCHHVARLKIKQGFYDPDQYTRVDEAYLINNGPVFETIVARTSPAGKTNKMATGYGVNSLLIDLDHDNTPIVAQADENYFWADIATYGSYRPNNKYYNVGYYQFYGVEVLQRVGCESFVTDSGVMITLNREIDNESSPWTWIIDSHPAPMDVIDFYRPNGDPQVMVEGKNEQLTDSLFHMGAGKTAQPTHGSLNGAAKSDEVVSEYIDTDNHLHFYILDKMFDDNGVLSYRVAVHSTEFDGSYSDQMSVSLGDSVDAANGKVATQEIIITNNGTQPGLYRLSNRMSSNSGTGKLLQNVIEVAPGETVSVPLYIQTPAYGTNDCGFTFTVTSEVSGNTANVSGSVGIEEPYSYAYSTEYKEHTDSIVPAPSTTDLTEMPGELDPQTWRVNPERRWEELQDHPYIDWMDDANLADDVEVMRGIVILVDFEDQPMFIGMEPGSDFMGNPVDAAHPGHDYMGNEIYGSVLDEHGITLPIAREDMASFYKALLNEGTYLHGLSINRFWRENSYGHWAIELDAVGPFTLPGMEWEYGIDNMNNTKNPDGTTKYSATAAKDFVTDSVQTFLNYQLSQPEENRVDLSDYNFGFILHAGYDESGLWQEASEMKYQTKDDIPEEAGPTFAELESIKAYGAKPQGTAEPIYRQSWGGRQTLVNDIHWAEQLFAGVDSETGEYIIDYTDANNNGYPDKGENWVGTRYVEFTCWKAGKTFWSCMTSYRAQENDGSGLAPGTSWRLSCQGESDGMGTFAHEFGHIKGINDNYNNPADMVRAYVGNWELMGAGDKSGPYGTHSRWIMPSLCGDVAPSNHVVRLKIKQGFYDKDMLSRVPEEYLIENGPVFETIVARNTPAGKTNKNAVGYGVNGLVIDMDHDNAPIVAKTDDDYFWTNVATFGTYNSRNKYYDRGYYQFYSMEVVQQISCETYMTDTGVLIALNREVDNENPPWTWIIDSHPAPIEVVDFYRPNGEAQGFLPGKNDQLADALFHMGTGKTAQPTKGSYEGTAKGDEVVSEYLDTWNNLHFYVLDKMYDDNGVLSYRVAVHSTEFDGTYSDTAAAALGTCSPAKPGYVASQEIKITNYGTDPGLYRVSTSNSANWPSKLLQTVIEVAPGETASLPVYMEVPDRARDTKLTVNVVSEVTGKRVTTTGTVTAGVTEPEVLPEYVPVLEDGTASASRVASVAPKYNGQNLNAYPADVDEPDWEASEDMSWDEWKDNPKVIWQNLTLDEMAANGIETSVKKGVLVMCDFADLPFIMSQPKGSDFMGNPKTDPIPVETVGEYWKTLLNTPCELNDYTSIDGFWRENSYGKWAVEIEAYGPYHLEGMEWEYGINSMNAGTNKRDVLKEALAAFLADETVDKKLSDFDFGFIVHAGYTESAVWQEAGEMMFPDKESVPDNFGPTVAELQAIKAYGARPQGTAEPVYNARGQLQNSITWAEQLFAGVSETGEYLIDPTDADGNGYPDKGANWVATRYIPWTSYKAGRSVWSYTSSYRAAAGDGSGLAPGTSWRISVQSEDNGMGTFAHEFGHISGINDNYNNAYETYNVNGTTQYVRTYAGNWELMSAGNQNGPGGTHARYGIPARAGDCIPAEHTVRTKIKQGFYDEGQYLPVNQAALVEAGPVFATIVARNVPTTGAYGVGYGYNAMTVNLTEDKTPIIAKGAPDYVWNNVGTHGSYRTNNPYYGKGYYQFYGMEVIQRTGYESFMYDEGVLLTMNRETNNENAPWTWVVDSHPEDINMVNFTYPGAASHGPAEDGSSDVMVTPGDNRQLIDALFHAGTAEGAVSEYEDPYNDLHFYVLDKMMDRAGVLSYRVAVRSLVQESAKNYDDPVEVVLGNSSTYAAGKVASQEVKITNKGSQPALYRLSSENTAGWDSKLMNEVIEVAPGATVTVPLYLTVPDGNYDDNEISFTATSEISGKSMTATSTARSQYKEPEYSKDYAEYTTSIVPEYEKKDLNEFPEELDPQSWTTNPQYRWEDLQVEHPYIDWMDDENLADDVNIMRGLVILVDFEDQPMFVGMEPGSDFMGNPVDANHPGHDFMGNMVPTEDITLPMAREDMATFYKALLNEGTYLHGLSINRFWRENSYGHWAVELEVVGPYTLPGMEWEYGVDSKQSWKIAPDSTSTKPGYTVNSTPKAIVADSVQLFLADQLSKPEDERENLTHYNFGFILHAGYDESGLWQEASEMLYQTKDDIPETAGPTFAELESIKAWGAKPQGLAEPKINSRGVVTNDIHWAEQMFAGISDTGEYIIDYTDANNNGYPDKGEKWAGTRYVEFTCWKAAKTVWSHATSYRAVAGDGSGLAPGTSWRISCQGESDGMGTFAHEFGHIKGIADNYNNQFQLNPLVRAYVGNWELMGAGDKSGPYGTHSRWIMPSTSGDVAPSNHVVRLKIKQGFYDEDQITRFPETYLIENGPVFETIVARNTPAGTTNKNAVGYGVNGIVLDLDVDNAPIVSQSSPDYFWSDVATFGSYNARNPYYGLGYYQFYSLEVIQKVGCESYMTDEGVLIALNREINNESAPWTWIIDSHPAPIPVVDFYRPNGEAQMMLPGKNDQLADALFHMGTGATAEPTHGTTDGTAPSDQVVSEYIDTYNNLHFYVLDKMYDSKGVLSYRVAALSTEFKGNYSDTAVVSMGECSPAAPGKIASQEAIITNCGTQPALYRLSATNSANWDSKLLQTVIEVAPGETVSVPLYLAVPAARARDTEVTFNVTSEVNGKKVSAKTTISPKAAEPYAYEPVEENLTSALPQYTGELTEDFPAQSDTKDWETSEEMTWDEWKDNPQVIWQNLNLDEMAANGIETDVKKGVLVMCDFADLPFIATQPVGSDFMGNPKTAMPAEFNGDVAEFWCTLLNTPCAINDYTSIDGFWRENSYGKWAVEIEAYGPYHLEGMEWEYGLDDMNGAGGAKRDVLEEALEAFLADETVDKKLADFDFGFIVHAGYTESAVWQEAGEMMFPDKESVPNNFGPRTDELEAIRAFGSKQTGGDSEEQRVTMQWGSYTWSYVVNDISWAEQLFAGKDANGRLIIGADADGDGYPDTGANWVQTRYIPWTSYKAGRSVWSYTSSYRVSTAAQAELSGLPIGSSWRISVQSEDNGMGTFAHEFGHISGIGDNYNNAYETYNVNGTTQYVRTYAGNWELMSAGNQNGPGGTHARYGIPARAGDCIPGEHSVRCKIKQGFYDDGQYLSVDQESLVENGPAFATVVARNVPTVGAYGTGYGYNALVVNLTEDKTPIIKKGAADYVWNNVGTHGSYTATNKYYGLGYYQFYAMETIQRTGYDSFMYDDGVLLTMNREVDNESAPWTWVVDAHPEDINLVNFTYPGAATHGPAEGDASDVMVTPGDNRQLVDAQFHAGTDEDVVSEYVDTWNDLHFYVLDKMYDENGVLSYRVAVRSEVQKAAKNYSDQMSVSVGDMTDPETGKVFGQEIKVTNNGTEPGLYRVTPSNDQDWPMMTSAEVIEVAPGQTVTVPLFTEVPQTVTEDNPYTVDVTSEVSGKSASTSGVISGLEEEPEPGFEYDEPTYEEETNTNSSLPELEDEALDEFPSAMDPQSWKTPDQMTWEDDYTPNPVIDWTTLELPDAMLIKGVVILVDYADKPFVMTQPVGSDPLGNPQIHVAEADLAQWWEDFLNKPQDFNHGASINEYWRENSYGKWKIEVEAFGPYHLDGMEWEYGIDDMNGAQGAKRNIESEAIQLFLADDSVDMTLADFDFGFVVHAGYDESGAWQEAGEMMFQTKEDVPASFGLSEEEKAAILAWGAKPLGTNEPVYVTEHWGPYTWTYQANDITWAKDLLEGANWAQTRYVPWTSYEVAKAVWSYTSSYTAKADDGSGLEPGTSWRISVQGESDGMATFAHEFGHIRSIGDNYNNPFGKPDGRSYTGGWEVMSRGSFAGPGGTHTRWEIPSVNGSSAPAPHTTRLKLKQEFYERDQYTRITEDYLIQNGPVFETIVAREVPTGSAIGSVGYGVNSLMIDLNSDNTPIITKNDPDYNWQTSTWGSYNERNPYYGKGYYQFYGMEVVQRVGYDSFSYDDGVLLTMNREIDNENAPFIWVIDSHPDDIGLIDFVRPNGEEAAVSLGDARQLADALFHAGTGEDVVSEYFDDYNNLHFYVLDKMYDDQGVLSYRVAVRSNEQINRRGYSDQMSVSLGNGVDPETGKVFGQEIKITNNGTQPGLYRVTPSNDQDWPMMLPANVVEVAPGETVTIPLYTQVPETVTEDNDYSVTVMSEVSRKSATVEGTIDGLVEEPEEPDYNDNNYTYDPDYTDNGTSTAPEFDGKDKKDFPDEMDPQNWKVPEELTWDDYTKNPVIDWTNMDLPNAMLIKGVVILVDYTDLPFVMTKPLGSDPLGNPQVHVAEEDLAEWWENFLNVPQELNHWTSINEYWRENSYGKWKIEVEAFGPYHLAGMEWEYGIDSKNGSRTTKRNMESESIALFMADMKAKNTGIDLSDYDFGFIVHAGYDESGGWQEAGEMMFQTKEDVPASFGMTAEEKAAIRAYGETGADISWAEHLLNGDNWIVTRYVPWTSWLVGKSVWSHTSTYRGQGVDFDGLAKNTAWRISVQGESDGMATFAHEFGHIRSIADNYNNPYGKPDGRSYTGGWEIMSRGSFAGPGGTHTRWEIPSLNGSSAPAPHTTRLKLKQEFYEDDQYTRVHEQFLIDNGPVFETIVAREVPTGSAIGSVGYGVNSLIIDMDKDNTPIVTKNDPEYTWQTSTWGSMRNQEFADRGYYQFYSMEVVQRIGYDSFSADDGVLLLMNREIANENAPFIWVVDMHPDDINLVDFVRPNGEKAMVSLGDARQLADALMKAGKGEGVVSEYYDEYNKLHFYVLDKMYDDQGVLSYRVAVHSEEFDGKYSDKMSVSMGDTSPAKAGKVGVQEVIITNNGTQPGLYRLDASNDQGWDAMFPYDVIEVAPGATVSVPLYFQVPAVRPKNNEFQVSVTSEVSGNGYTTTGTVVPYGGQGGSGNGDDSDKPSRPGKDDTPSVNPPAPVDDGLPFVDVLRSDWFYNDVYTAYKDGLINGRTATTYVPEGNVTIAEAIKLAACMHQLYTDGKVSLTNGPGSTWYSTYVDYCVANGIIKAGEYPNVDVIATRAQFASIFAAALPDAALKPINNITDGKIPDVKMADSYGPAVYKLYNAGILEGNDAIGTFAPNTNIKRSEVAAIVNRMMHPENRKTLNL